MQMRYRPWAHRRTQQRPRQGSWTWRDTAYVWHLPIALGVGAPLVVLAAWLAVR
jgi:hypothetical protein